MTDPDRPDLSDPGAARRSNPSIPETGRPSGEAGPHGSGGASSPEPGSAAGPGPGPGSSRESAGPSGGSGHGSSVAPAASSGRGSSQGAFGPSWGAAYGGTSSGDTGPVATRPGSRSDDAAGSLHALDQPIDDSDLRERLDRPGLARSTRILLLLVAAVVLFGLGALLGRATAPDTGPGSAPPAVGVIESVQVTGAYPLVTVRSADGTLTTVRTSAGTTVATPRPAGPASLRTGQPVTISSERGQDGALTATRVDVPPGS